MMTTRDLLSDIEHRFDELRRDLMNSFGTGGELNVPRMPACDLHEEPDAYSLTVELPGVEKEDIRLEIEENGVHIRAEHKTERTEQKKGTVRTERSSRSFERFVGLREKVSADGARATFKNGVLDVRIPKVAPEQRSRRAVDID